MTQLPNDLVTSHHTHHRHKKPLRRRLKHNLKTFWRQRWGVVIAILLGLIISFFFMPALIRFFSEAD